MGSRGCHCALASGVYITTFSQGSEGQCREASARQLGGVWVSSRLEGINEIEVRGRAGYS